jgi:hypothetical protein
MVNDQKNKKRNKAKKALNMKDKAKKALSKRDSK